MNDALAHALLRLLLGSELGSTGQQADNRVSLEGVTWRAREDGALEVGLRKLEADALRLAGGPLTVEAGRIALHRIVAQAHLVNGQPRLRALEAAAAELSGVKVQGPLDLPAAAKGAGATAAGAWRLEPLAAADGTIRAEIVDAHLLFDADVTVPVRQGQVSFNDASVEHVGPDSRMGVSRMGLYVDAPNGRSYLYQFTSAAIAGVEYEHRGALLGPWVTDRGRLRLQPFLEGLLRQGPGGAGLRFTDQARLLLDRTALSGDLQLGDGLFAAPGVQAGLAGRAEGRNAIRLHSEAVGRGLGGDIASLSVRHATLAVGEGTLGCDALTGSLGLRLSVDGGQWRFAFDVPRIDVAGLRLQARSGAPGA